VVEFISQVVVPWAGSFEASVMARGEPGLPEGFDWQGQRYRILQRLEQWKESSREGGRAGGELYLRRHWYRLRMSDGSLWTVYCLRQAPQGKAARRRWVLYERRDHGAYTESGED